MFDLDGTVRARPVEETLEWLLESGVFKRIGLSRVCDVGRLDVTGLHVHAAVRPNARALATSQGKGVSRELAMVSAIMESIETWHAENLPPASLYGSYNDLSATHRLALVSEIKPAMVAGEQFEDVELDWIEGRDALSDESVYIPRAPLNLDFANATARGGLHGSSNGLASGNTLDEAIIHALCETVERETERDLANRLSDDTRVDVSTITNASLQTLAARIEASGAAIELYDLTAFTPGRIPTFSAFINESDFLRGAGSLRGAGTHPSSVVAASRALTEAAQARCVMISGSRDDMPPSMFEQRQERRPLLGQTPDVRTGDRPFEDVRFAATNLSELRREIAERLRDDGYVPAVYVDLTRDDIGVPVVATVVGGCMFDHTSHRNSNAWNGL